MVHARVDTTFDPAMGLTTQGVGVGKFGVKNPNLYLYGLKKGGWRTKPSWSGLLNSELKHGPGGEYLPVTSPTSVPGRED